MRLRQRDFEQLLEFRTGLRRFMRWSEQRAQEAGLTPAKHQLLLAIKGHRDRRGPTVGELADYLVLRHHSVVGLVDRAVADGLVRRNADPESKSAVRVSLTPLGGERLDELAESHLEEIAHLGPTMRALWEALERDGRDPPHPAARQSATAGSPRRPRARRSHGRRRRSEPGGTSFGLRVQAPDR